MSWLRLQAIGSAVLAPLELVFWATSGGGYFWPVWVWIGLALALVGHARLARRFGWLRRRVETLARSRTGVLDAQAAELRRIERDLHDGAQARIVSLGMHIGLAEQLVRTDPDAAAALLAEARATTLTALDELRSVMSAVHPAVLADRGLTGAVRALALDLAVPVEVRSAWTGRAPAAIESAVYFAVAECLANVVKHSGATGAAVTLAETGGRLVATVTDDGVGGAAVGPGTGLVGVARRLEAFDGTVTVSSPPGGPTAIRLEVPCAPSWPRTSPSSATA
jgi:signal transduction histidine kinase